MTIFATQSQAQDHFASSPLLTSARGFARPIAADEGEFVSRQLLAVLDEYYVHLPLKRSSLGVEPVQDARLLLDEVRFVQSDVEFYERIFDILKRLRDRHTSVRLPNPWRGMVAYLPFAVESYFDESGRHLIVSKLMADVGDPEFTEGVEITHWNGVPIRRKVEALSWDTEGANPFARIAIALRSLTVRPLGYMRQPDEDWVTVTYLTGEGRHRSVVIAWRIYFPSAGSAAGAANITAAADRALVQAVDRNTLIVNNTWYDLYSGTGAPPRAGISEQWRDFFKTRTVSSSSGQWGYLRIFSFDTSDSAGFVAEVARLLEELPQDGVIIDLRGNPGGSIPAGEGVMRLFSDRTVRTAPVSFRNTDAARRLGDLSPFLRWKHSLAIQHETGDVFSQGFPLTPDDIGPRGVYPGRVLLVIDALCYSTTDFFAAGMQDNGLAMIVGTDPVTGAGGANVWNHTTLTSFVSQFGGEIQAMPNEVDVDVAVRRATRVGVNEGLPLEGLGVFADTTYQLTRRDLIEGNEDLLAFCGELLGQPS